ncbi:MAG TPA: RsmE family RNA methyltransferase [Myxococcota bacterium]|nr:RsmE family RNA methyltransferase [Myxococcota bacterium]
MHRSYVAKEWIDSFLVDPKTPLPKDAEQRFFLVVRIAKNETVAVFDGFGREIRGVLDKSANHAVFRAATMIEAQPVKTEIVLIQAAIAYTKMEETIRRGVEYGVDRFIIVAAKNSERYCFDKLVTKKERLTRIACDACRQAGRYFLPTISFSKHIDHMIKENENSVGLGVFGDTTSNTLLSHVLKGANVVEDGFYIVVGPEGGFQQTELDALRRAAFIGVKWAPFVLRTELAAIGAIAIFHAFSGRA